MDNITDTIKENWSVIKETIRRESSPWSFTLLRMM